MSSPDLKLMLQSHQGADLSQLRNTVALLAKHLKSLNERLATLRHSIRIVSSSKIKERYLKRTHSLVWEQQTIQRIVDEYRKKLNDLLAHEEAKATAEEKQRQIPPKNLKLFELLDVDTKTFTTEDKLSTIIETKQDDLSKDGENKTTSNNETIKRKIVEEHAKGVTLSQQDDIKKRRTSEEEKQCTDEIVINSQDEALKYVTALQEYALMNENFGATGLLVEVEKSFKNPAISSDFEV
ncbi:uncharacterized protein LOC133841137 isoform X1 [Drosophila sulfurigaster albostrigata]|uniref:uncharacterized protein LOC133841137 isoform X1 n=1 Tax=Drosophila sulfurigaster albostrigata TaxID=89887 RepID=UPI002D21AE8B|nr:uncharacterized protein LOC133841137 isoform X1 [Drosophila sulfurigaster albostrigata]